MITMTTVPASSPHNSYLCLVEALGIAACCWDYCSLILRRLAIEHTFPSCVCTGFTHSADPNTHICRHPKRRSLSFSLARVCVCAQHTVSGGFLHSIPIHGNAFHVLYIRRVKIEVFIVALTDWLSVCLSVRAFGEQSSPHRNSHKSNAMAMHNNTIDVDEFWFSLCDIVNCPPNSVSNEFFWIEKETLGCAQTAITVEEVAFFCRQSNHALFLHFHQKPSNRQRCFPSID